MLIKDIVRAEPEYRALVGDLARAFRGRSLPFAVCGLCEGASDAMLAALFSDLREHADGAALLILPEEKECLRLQQYFSHYGLRAAFFSARDLTFYDVTASHEYEHERLSLLWRLLGGELDVVLTTPDAALGFTMSREKLRGATVSLGINSTVDPATLAENLTAAGYARVELVEGAGQFAVRGGIIDIYAPALRAMSADSISIFHSAPIRVEFFGDEVDRIGIFDVETQRIHTMLTDCELTPAREVLLTADARARIREAVEQQLNKCKDERAAKELEKELAALEIGGDLSFADKYFVLCDEARECLLSYFNPHTLVVLRDTNAINDRLKAAVWHMDETVKELTLMDNVLEIRDLCTCFFTESGTVRSVDGVSFDIPAGTVVGVVGESGCGKSTTGLSVMGLLQEPQGKITGGSIRLNDGKDTWELVGLPERQLCRLRGNVMSMIFQEPMTALNPVMRIGRQLSEVLQLHTGRCGRQQVVELLKSVGIPNPRGVARMYPHNLSGGMRQRVMIAMALACHPRLVIADEPTTALDVTIQAQILELLRQLKDTHGSAVMLITHDLGVVAQLADFVVVMYAGRVVEAGTVREIFHSPAHPYTLGLMASKPVIGKGQEQLFSIPGSVPDPAALPEGCYFRERCDRAEEDCRGDYPCQVYLSPTHRVSCYRHKEESNG